MAVESKGTRKNSSNGDTLAKETDQVKYESLSQAMQYLNQLLRADENFDIIHRTIQVGKKEGCIYFIDGFCKDEVMQKMLEYFMKLKDEELPEQADEMTKLCLPYIEVDTEEDLNKIANGILSGIFVLLLDGYTKALMIDARTYPARSVTEPEKDKSLRGSKDGFVETIVFNTALIRRRIRSPKLRMEMYCLGTTSKTDVVLCYMEERVDEDFLKRIRAKLESCKVDALTMNQESLAECLYKGRWFNPFPKFKYTERPDVASAQVLEGDIVILVDNSPSAMVAPTSVFDIVQEADDYYFPPVTGTYLRLSRFIIAVLTYAMTPFFLLLMKNPQLIPQGFEFILVKEPSNIPLILQFLILELAIDGLRLAAVNTPNMLSTPLSVMAALVLGEFSVNSGWFNSEVMLYMAFVAISSYTQSNYEFGYALKFMRIINLILTQFFGIFGFVGGVVLLAVSIIANKTVSGQGYAYPLIPFNGKQLFLRMFRRRLPGSEQ